MCGVLRKHTNTPKVEEDRVQAIFGKCEEEQPGFSLNDNVLNGTEREEKRSWTISKNQKMLKETRSRGGREEEREEEESWVESGIERGDQNKQGWYKAE